MRLASLVGRGSDEKAFEEQRREMVERQLRGRGIVDARVLQAMLAVPRHEFVSPAFRHESYSDQPVPIGDGQTISQPFVVAAMTGALELSGPERLLEVGTGCGYQTAVLARLASEVFSIECRPALARAARERLAALGCENVHVREGDGGSGWSEAAPFDAILVAAAAPEVPAPLIAQLAPGGRMAIPIGDEWYQELVQLRKRAGRVERRWLFACRFVPLAGIHGSDRPLCR